MQMEIGGTGVGTVDRQIGRDFVQQEGFVVGLKAFVGAIVERLRTIRRLELRIPVAIDCDEVLHVETKRRAIRMSQADRLEIARSMHVHDVLRSAPLLRSQRHCEFWASRLTKRQASPARRCGRACAEENSMVARDVRSMAGSDCQAPVRGGACFRGATAAV